MAYLKSYSCSKCGGVLVFDSDQEFFECPFCGTGFDVVDFHGEELLSQANECLANSDFLTAKDKYGKLLEKDPCNKDALLGMILSEAKVTSLDGLKDYNFYKKCDLKAVRKAVDIAVKRAPEQALPLFEKISDLVSLDEEMKPLVDEVNVVASEISNETLALSRKIANIQNNKHTGVLITTSIIFALILLMTFYIGGSDSLDFSSFLILLFFVGTYIAGLIGFYFFSKSRKDKTVEACQMVVKAKKDSYGNISKIDSIRDNYTDEYAGLWKLKIEADKAGSAASKVPEKASDTSLEASMDENSDKVILCDKCAARLSLNREKRVFECNSCGVAYGVSLFFGMPLEKALNAINMGQYEDAEKRFSNLLMVNPADFDGLLGRILCTGKWNNVSNITVSEDLRPITYKNLLVMADKASESAGEGDKEYFGNLKKLLGLLEELYLIDYKEKAAGRKLEDLEVKDRIFTSENYSMNAANYREKWQIQDDLKPYVSRKKDLEYNFSKIKDTLLKMRSDSALCK